MPKQIGSSIIINILACLISSVVPSKRKKWTCQSRSRRVPWKLLEGWNTSPLKKGWESWCCLPWRRLQGDLTVALQYMKYFCKIYRLLLLCMLVLSDTKTLSKTPKHSDQLHLNDYWYAMSHNILFIPEDFQNLIMGCFFPFSL